MAPDTATHLTVTQVAEMLQISIHTVERWIEAGQIGVIRIGRVKRIPRHEVDRLVTPARTH